jgi:hypothetical protein
MAGGPPRVDRHTRRRSVQAYAAWQVMPAKLRRDPKPAPARAPTARAPTASKPPQGSWPGSIPKARPWPCRRQADAGQWLSTAPSACYARTSSSGPPAHHHCPHLQVPPPPRTVGPATDPQQRWGQLARLLHDGSLNIIDRVAGCLLLLSGQQQSRIAAMTTDQVVRRSDGVFVHLGKCEIPTPEPSAAC